MRFVEEPARPAWHAKALDAASGADLHTLIDLLTATREIGRLANLISGTADEASTGRQSFCFRTRG